MSRAPTPSNEGPNDPAQQLAAMFDVATEAPEDFERAVHQYLARLETAPQGKHDPGEPDPGEPDPGEPNPDECRALIQWLLHMALATHERLRVPHARPPQLRQLETILLHRPTVETSFSQMHIDAASALRRAAVVEEGPTLLVGDDDAVSAALHLLGHVDLHVVDVDSRLLAYLRPFASTYHCDVFRDSPPASLLRRCTTAIIDPMRDFDGCMAFMDFAVACIAPGGTLLLADHPNWNPELPYVLKALPGFELTLEKTLRLMHRYPFDLSWRPDLAPHAAILDVESEWLEQVADHVSGWSHLYVLRKSAT